MAQKVEVVLIDDIDGSAADETVTFSLDGTHYEIDLAARRAAELRAVLDPWISHARRINVRASRGARARGSVAAIRDWAKANGLEVNERGRIPARIREAYENSTR